MNKPLSLAAEARTEIRDAAQWYEERRAGLGEAFVAAVNEALARVADLGPDSQPVLGVPLELGVRRVRVRRFPYLVVFVELPSSIRILAVSHARRRPGYWRRRL